jgi:hypothetical protein
MADGIQINDAALEISPAGLEALVTGKGAEVRVTKVDVSVSPEALNTLLSGLAPAGTSAQVGDGSLQVTASHEGKRVLLDLALGGLQLELSPDGVRLVSGPPPAASGPSSG